jgi:hypothetical protein
MVRSACRRLECFWETICLAVHVSPSCSDQNVYPARHGISTVATRLGILSASDRLRSSEPQKREGSMVALSRGSQCPPFGSSTFVTLGVVLGVVWVGLVSGAAASEQGKTTYRLLTGKGRAVCEAYLRNLEAFRPGERDPVCAPRPHPTNADFTEPNWETMDLWQNNELIYRAEMSWGIYRDHPERHPPYDQWRKDFETQVRAGAIHPSLKRTRIEFVKGKPATVVAYARNPDGCEADFSRDGASADTGYHWFFFDENTQTLERDASGGYGSDLAGAILLFRGRPISINAPVTAEEIYLYDNPARNPVYAPVLRCRYDVDDAAKPASMRKQRPLSSR